MINPTLTTHERSSSAKYTLDRDSAAPRISVVIPLYNEEESIPHLRTALHQALESCGYSYEIIIVDDGSKDKSFVLLREWALQDDHMTVIRLRHGVSRKPGEMTGQKTDDTGFLLW